MALVLGCASHDSSSPAPAPSSGSAGSGSEASNGKEPTTKITCEWAHGHHPADVPECQCHSEGGTGAELEFGGICYNDSGGDDPVRWCADPGYPREGSCSYWDLQPWRCSAQGDGSCRCAFTYFDSLSSLLFCDSQHDVWQEPAHCCFDGSMCTCDPGSGQCKDGEQPVSDCASYAALGLAPPPSSCPSGQIEVTSCGMPTTPPAAQGGTSSADCSYDCRIDGDLACCYVSTADGRCELYCCDSSGCY